MSKVYFLPILSAIVGYIKAASTVVTDGSTVRYEHSSRVKL